MRGVNFGGWFSQIEAIEQKDPARFPGRLAHLQTFLGADDFRQVAGWGFDHVRLPVDWDVVFHPDLQPREDILRLLDAAIDGLLGQGLQVIFDLHRCPGHDFDEGARSDQQFFFDPALRQDCKTVWSHLGERYGHRNGVILDVLNEPVAPTAEIWNTVKDELARHIRSVAPNATLLVASNRWNHAEEFAHLTPLDDANVIYSFHLYNPVLFTHQKAPWMADVFQVERPYPGDYRIADRGQTRSIIDTGVWDKNRLAQAMEPVFRFRERHQVRVTCNEFGVYMGGADSRSRHNWLRDTLELFDENRIGWSYWNYKNLDFGIISDGESLFADDPGYDHPGRINRELLELLQAH